MRGFSKRPDLAEAAMVMDGEIEDNVLMRKVGEGALRNVFLLRSPGLLLTSGKAEQNSTENRFKQ